MQITKPNAACTITAATLFLAVCSYAFAVCIDAPSFGAGELFVEAGDYAQTVLMIGQPTVGRVENGAAYAIIGGVVCWNDDRDLIGDLNGDDCVDNVDLDMLMDNYGQQGCCLVGDIIRDGIVDLSDRMELLEYMGEGDGCP